jgi:hypothetical protein
LSSGLPGNKIIPAKLFVSFLALKLLGTERYAHVSVRPSSAWGPSLASMSFQNAPPYPRIPTHWMKSIFSGFRRLLSSKGIA